MQLFFSFSFLVRFLFSVGFLLFLLSFDLCRTFCTPVGLLLYQVAERFLILEIVFGKKRDRPIGMLLLVFATAPSEFDLFQLLQDLIRYPKVPRLRGRKKILRVAERYDPAVFQADVDRQRDFSVGVLLDSFADLNFAKTVA